MFAQAPRVLIVTLFLLATACSALADGTRLKPFLDHVNGRTPRDSETLLRTAHPRLHETFVQNLATYNNWSHTQVKEVLTKANGYSTCEYNGWFFSDGLRGVGNSYTLGMIYRHSRPGEKFACVNGKPIWSGTCGNAIKATGGDPRMVCRDTGTEHASVTVVTGEVFWDDMYVGPNVTTTTSDSNLFECHIQP